MNVGVNITGLAELREKIARIQAKTEDLSPALLRSGLVVLKAAADRIDSGGPGWAANLSGTPLLHDTGRLLSSLTVGGADNETDQSGNTIVVGTNVKYAAWLQDGTGIFGERGVPIVPTNSSFLRFVSGGHTFFTKSVKGVPPRPFLYVDDAVAEKVRDVFANYILSDSDNS